MKSINILIVDDEQPARKKIRSYLKDEVNIHSIIDAKNGIEAVKMIQEKKPDLVFLDIQMPGLNGFEVIEKVGIENMPAVVFVTAYDQYAIDAFEVQAVDYLLKPFHQERFKKSFYRALEQIHLGDKGYIVVKRLVEEINKSRKYLQRIKVKRGPRIFFIKTNDIEYISADEKYVKIHTTDNSYLIRDTMNRIEQNLDPTKFARTHRSFIINIDFIKEIQPWSHGDYIVILKNGKRLNLSRRFSDRLLGKF